MITLYLNVPKDKEDGEGKKSYADTLKSAIGSGYAIPMGQAIKCAPGFDVVLLCQTIRRVTVFVRKLGPGLPTEVLGILVWDTCKHSLAKGYL